MHLPTRRCCFMIKFCATRLVYLPDCIHITEYTDEKAWWLTEIRIICMNRVCACLKTLAAVDQVSPTKRLHVQLVLLLHIVINQPSNP